MTTLVTDTGPLNYLLQTQEFAFLPRMLSEVLVPLSVRTELLHPKAPPVVRDWIAVPPSCLKSESPKIRVGGAELGRAELDAISLAVETGAWLLIDDQEARFFAKDKVSRLVGTIGLLELASAEGLLDLNVALKKLHDTTHSHSAKLLEESLARNQARKRHQDAK